LIIRYKTKVIKYIFVISVLLFLVLPLLFIDTSRAYSSTENRILAGMPNIMDCNRTYIFKQIDDYINDRIGFRNYFVVINTLIDRIILRETQKDRVLFGENNWLYYIDKIDGDNLSDFQKKNLFDVAAIDQFISQIEKRKQWCERNGIRFIFIIAPNKHNIYPEYYPMDRPNGMTRTDQIINNVPNELINNIIFPRDYILLKKVYNTVPLYYETDTHWNKLGAYYAYELLYKKIEYMFPDIFFPDIQYNKIITETIGGDLIPMTGLKTYGKMTEINIEPDSSWASYYTYEKSDDTNRINIKNVNVDLPKAIIFRDSFFDALEPFTSTLFSLAEYVRKMPDENDKQYILENKFDILIWEIVERNVTQVLNLNWQ
jgi:hypothetical protein